MILITVGFFQAIRRASGTWCSHTTTRLVSLFADRVGGSSSSPSSSASSGPSSTTSDAMTTAAGPRPVGHLFILIVPLIGMLVYLIARPRRSADWKRISSEASECHDRGHWPHRAMAVHRASAVLAERRAADSTASVTLGAVDHSSVALTSGLQPSASCGPTWAESPGADHRARKERRHEHRRPPERRRTKGAREECRRASSHRPRTPDGRQLRTDPTRSRLLEEQDATREHGSRAGPSRADDGVAVHVLPGCGEDHGH